MMRNLKNSSSAAGAKNDRSRGRNRQAVLSEIRAAGQIGRAAIARSLGLSTQAVSNIIADLEADGLLVERGMHSAGRGLPAMQYGLNPTGGFALGIEVRPDALFLALLDLEGQPVSTRRKALVDHAPETVVGEVTSLLKQMLAKSDVVAERIIGAGVVLPGPFGQTGLSGKGPVLIGWQDIDAADLFASALDLPVEVSNDANAAAMAERFGGAAQNLDHYAYLYFGAGLGLGLVSQGQLISGAFGNAGEIGHLPISTPNGMRPLEEVLSRDAVRRHLEEGGADAAPVDLERIASLYAEKDLRLSEWLMQATAALSQAVGVIENLFDPQSIILGGAMPEEVLEHLVHQTQLPDLTVSHRPDSPLPRLMVGDAGRLTAARRGAAMVLNRAFTPEALPVRHFQS